MAKNTKISKSTVDKMPFNASGQSLYWDTALKGFGVRVGRISKAFIVQKKLNGKTVRSTIGTYGQITPEQARREAQRILGEITTGKNPIDEKKQARAKTISLRDVFSDYLESRKTLKPKTVYNYRSLMDTCFHGWLRKPIGDISKDMIERHHRMIGEKHGEAYANFAMRLLRAVFNFAIGRYEDSKGKSLIQENPVKRLSQVRAWYKIKRRDDYVNANELPAFFEAVENLETTTMRDYMLTLLFTGLRREEGASLGWDQVDFRNKTLTIIDTKNDEKLVLPLSDYLEALLKHRYETARVNEYVFPGSGDKGHIIEPKRAIKRIREELGTQLTIHGLRRTFVTIGESLDLSSYAIKRLVNHKMGGDVTAGYVVKDVERLRGAMQKITDAILKHAGKKGKAKVIPLKAGEHIK